MVSWASNGSTDGVVVTVPDPSPEAPVVDHVTTPPAGVGFMSLSHWLL